MKNSEIKQFSTKELQERIEEEMQVLVKMRLNHAVSPLDNPLKLRHIKKDIARLKTEMQARINTENQNS